MIAETICQHFFYRPSARIFIAYITDFIIEGAREDRSVAELMSIGATILTTDDVLPGVATLIPLIQVEAHFLDGTKLVSIHNPIGTANK